MKTIIKRELLSYFATMTGWVFIGLFVFMSAVYFSIINVLGLLPYYNLTLQNKTIMFMIFVPALTMRFFAGEARQNTDKLLFTLPISAVEIVLGKFFGGVLLFLFALGLTLIFPFILSFFGTLPVAHIAGTFIGFALVGCAFIAVGLLISAVSNSQILSAIGTFCTILFLFLVDVVVSILPSGELASVIYAFALVIIAAVLLYAFTKNFYAAMTTGAMGSFLIALTYFAMNDMYTGLITRSFRWLSIMSRFDNFSRGILNISDIIYYITFAAALVIITITVVDVRRNEG
ncbi:MAG: ABC transporter permease [Defluviitaleaceae bacterium]|nr:ABC transporter permease [Defluviitaleaceae bacterium]